MYSTNAADYSSNISSGINIIIPSPFTYTNPTAASQYDATTVSSIVFGIFMALVAIYDICKNGNQWNGAYDRPEVC